jgi:hypothetical protein
MTRFDRCRKYGDATRCSVSSESEPAPTRKIAPYERFDIDSGDLGPDLETRLAMPSASHCHPSIQTGSLC